MNRRILAFTQDGQGDWRARLSCGHFRHLRHHPPHAERAWVADAEERRRRLGSELPCTACDRLQPPDDLEAYRRTPDFDNASVPAGLLRAHQTKSGVWGRIEVLQGRLDYVLEPPGERRIPLAKGETAHIPPERPHHVSLDPGCRFRVVFLRLPPADEAGHG